ncbi:cellulose synthase [Actinomadura sp. ATCC 31491]|uniref:Cellulose synthase n=1 Tax=Actinomadura luzonensis TaxID=2805427 RepID=A0ABT0FWA3_9ACTN|nr:cellulose synthase [Actinomadura luzonensis]MCK2216438.1 cellulose synthase [Actinomadura luzonensis]
MDFNQIAWLPLCVGVTAAGLVLSFLAFRRRGAASGLRVMAWALLPLAAYLTGALQALWNIGTTAVGFVTGLVLNPAVWAGIAVAGLAAVLFVVSGFLRGRKLAVGRRKTSGEGQRPAAATGAAQRPAAPGAKPKPAVAAQQPAQPAQKPGQKRPAAGAGAAGDDDFSDIEELLKRRGIS